MGYVSDCSLVKCIMVVMMGYVGQGFRLSLGTSAKMFSNAAIHVVILENNHRIRTIWRLIFVESPLIEGPSCCSSNIAVTEKLRDTPAAFLALLTTCFKHKKRAHQGPSCCSSNIAVTEKLRDTPAAFLALLTTCFKHKKRAHQGPSCSSSNIAVTEKLRDTPAAFLALLTTCFKHKKRAHQGPSCSSSNIAVTEKLRDTPAAFLALLTTCFKHKKRAHQTWLCEHDNAIIKECTPPSYSFYNYPRGTGHGGIGLICKDSVNVCTIPLSHATQTFEHASVIDRTSGIQYIIVYRPPPSQVNNLKTTDFLIEFDEFIGEISLLPSKVMIAGDFNVHVDDPDKPDVRRFISSYESAGFRQYVDGPTHRYGHTLDLVFAREDDQIIHGCEVQENDLSDHYMIHCYVNRNKPLQMKSCVKIRNYKQINRDAFKVDLLEGFNNIPEDLSLDEVVNEYNTLVRNVLDNHAPQTEKEKVLKTRFPWYDDEIRTQTHVRRRLERKWRRSRVLEDRQAFKDQKSSIMDPIPTWLLQDTIDVFLPIFSRIINESLESGIFPKLLGSAVISPVLKKSSLDRNILKNYRPVSNILFLSKVLEKVVAMQLKIHIQENNLDDMYQSAYKSNCSTETALLKVKSDVLNAVDRGEGPSCSSSNIAVTEKLRDTPAAFLALLTTCFKHKKRAHQPESSPDAVNDDLCGNQHDIPTNCIKTQKDSKGPKLISGKAALSKMTETEGTKLDNP
ncbi:hypothetical protein HOLleu_14687 [Holothuria leucospilota]|uniref:Endonuclease/exonuclease/phosphatase domain-containing protein n=1 Tax=Holothuria leucospilota TaxID=206669 RepID=A0A9Q1C7Z0_HOLLE|nr:hypothetical protein HOLleu_14687 [Holothuria leucospilota]